MGRSTLKHQIKSNLIQKTRIGESRHEAKAQLKSEKGENYTFETAVPTIHSIKTFDTYFEHCSRFADWCVTEKGVSKNSSLEKIEKYAPEYLEAKEREGLSLYSLKAYRAALGKLYGHEIGYKFKEHRTYDKIERSRKTAVRDKNFSEERNRDLVTIAKATGGRREDIEHLTPDNFFKDKNVMYVRFLQSKGGRERVAPVLPQYKKEVEEILKGKEPNAPIFERVHNAADIHSYRREYAKELYSLVQKDKELKEKYERRYPQREEEVKGKYYYSHSKEHPFKGERDNIYIVTQALGHNRLEVTVNHYLK